MSGARLHRILILDDDRALAQVVADAARASGLDPEILSDPRRFDEVFAQGTFIGVMVDLAMPHRDGIEILRRLAELDPGARVILTSGYDRATLYTAHQLGRALGLDVIGDLAKPFRLADVRRLFGQLMSASTGAQGVSRTPDRTITGAELATGLERGEFAYHFQPQIELATHHTVGYEALARWTRADGTTVPPGMFIPLAEREGLIDSLTWTLLRQELPRFPVLERCAPGCTLSFNVSASMLTNLSLPDQLLALCLEYSVDPARLTVEVTESAVMRDLARSLDVLARFRLKGFRMSIDDFGTGSAMLEQLRRLPITEIKIDHSFVGECAAQPKARAIVENIIDLAGRLGGLHTVAEGVESAVTSALLERLGVRCAQGYLYGRPVPLDRLQSEGRRA